MPASQPVPPDQINRMQADLDHPDLHYRLRTLHELKHLAASGRIALDPPQAAVNMHCHSFYSYNARGYSPSRIAWEMMRRGVQLAGVIDFDVLDAVDEVLAASDALLYPFTAGIESRVYVAEYRNDVLNSPNEPGIAYYCGQGFVGKPAAGSKAHDVLSGMAARARERNEAMLRRVNAYLGDVQLDYQKDVIPLSAAGNATERHMLEAYDKKAAALIPHRAARVQFWAARLHLSIEETDRALDDSVQFRNLMRNRLMKHGSPGYAAPDPANFPTLQEAVAFIRDCGAMPMYAWLDGTNSGEEDAELLLDYFLGAGGVGLNIIPDRNWSIKNPEEKARKVEKLNEIIALARARHTPINVGTEMNSPSQPVVDHFNAPELKPHVQTFLDGARIVWGHSLLLRHGGFGYLSKQAEVVFGKDLARKNAFFLDVGSRPVPHGAALGALRTASREGSVSGVLKALPAP